MSPPGCPWAGQRRSAPQEEHEGQGKWQAELGDDPHQMPRNLAAPTVQVSGLPVQASRTSELRGGVLLRGGTCRKDLGMKRPRLQGSLKSSGLVSDFG